MATSVIDINLDILKKALRIIDPRIQRGILRTKDGKTYELPSRVLKPRGAGGHITHAFREILYAAGENGNKEVTYQRGRRMRISSKGVSSLKEIFRH